MSTTTNNAASLYEAAEMMDKSELVSLLVEAQLKVDAHCEHLLQMGAAVKAKVVTKQKKKLDKVKAELSKVKAELAAAEALIVKGVVDVQSECFNAGRELDKVKEVNKEMRLMLLADSSGWKNLMGETENPLTLIKQLKEELDRSRRIATLAKEAVTARNDWALFWLKGSSERVRAAGGAWELTAAEAEEREIDIFDVIACRLVFLTRRASEEEQAEMLSLIHISEPTRPY